MIVRFFVFFFGYQFLLSENLKHSVIIWKITGMINYVYLLIYRGVECDVIRRAVVTFFYQYNQTNAKLFLYLRYSGFFISHNLFLVIIKIVGQIPFLKILILKIQSIIFSSIINILNIKFNFWAGSFVVHFIHNSFYSFIYFVKRWFDLIQIYNFKT